MPDRVCGASAIIKYRVNTGGVMGYLGSKAASGAYQAIIASMPPHDTYIETHLGSGAVLKRNPPCSRSIGVDIDKKVIAVAAAPGLELYQADAVTFLRGFDFSAAGRVLIYCDPSYLLSTRSSRHRYKHEYTEVEHKTLLLLLRDLAAAGAAVMVSGYPSALYDELLYDWRNLEFQVMTRGGVRTEKLWFSFDASAAHWSTFAGVNALDRQRIKRKAAGWAEKYRNLPPAERLAILAALLESDSHS